MLTGSKFVEKELNDAHIDSETIQIDR
ncbi:MAG: hypothetical protein H6Q56_1092, partial [Deltaproteobacteria bacterium]|nr:hypothetical protein [Deltaproteobacteria bacterium]